MVLQVFFHPPPFMPQKNNHLTSRVLYKIILGQQKNPQSFNLENIAVWMSDVIDAMNMDGRFLTVFAAQLWLSEIVKVL